MEGHRQTPQLNDDAEVAKDPPPDPPAEDMDKPLKPGELRKLEADWLATYSEGLQIPGEMKSCDQLNAKHFRQFRSGALTFTRNGLYSPYE